MAWTSSEWGKFWLWSSIWPWRSRSIVPQNNRDLNQGLLHLWSKFGDPSLKGWWVIAQTSWGLTHTHGHTHRQMQARTIPEGQNWPRVIKQGKSEGFDSCDRPNNLTQIGFKSSIFQPCDFEIWLMTSKNYRAPLLLYIKLCASSQTPRWIPTAVAVRKHSIRVKISDFLPRVTLKNNRDPLPCYIKLCVSFQSHRWIQTKVTVRKRSIRAKMGDFLPRVTLKFDG